MNAGFKCYCFSGLKKVSVSKFKEIIYLASGAGEDLATGILANYAVECMYNNDSHFGIKHLEEIISVDYFFQFLRRKGIAIQTELKCTKKNPTGMSILAAPAQEKQRLLILLPSVIIF